MTMFKPGDKVAFFIPTHPQRKPEPCTIVKVGATTYHAVDENDNWFTSHHENFHTVEAWLPKEQDQGSPSPVTPVDQYSDRFGNHVTVNLGGLPPRQPQAQKSARVIIGISGRKGHGKDTAAQALQGFENVKFAGPIKAMARAFFAYVGMSEDFIERIVDGPIADKEMPLDCLGGKSSRQFQQYLGTEFGRDLIWQDLWVNAAKMRAEQFPRVVITDLRFPNECEAIKSWGGATVRIKNPRVEYTPGEHPSEDLVDGLSVAFEITNDGSIEDLHGKVRSVAAFCGVSLTDVEKA
jgi:hypothetical protein